MLGVQKVLDDEVWYGMDHAAAGVWGVHLCALGMHVHTIVSEVFGTGATASICSPLGACLALLVGR